MICCAQGELSGHGEDSWSCRENRGSGRPSRSSIYLSILEFFKSNYLSHMFNMELDFQSLFGLQVTWYAQLYSLAEIPQLPPPSAFGLVYEGAIGQPRWTTSPCDPWFILIRFNGLWRITNYGKGSCVKRAIKRCRDVEKWSHSAELDPFPTTQQIRYRFEQYLWICSDFSGSGYNLSKNSWSSSGSDPKTRQEKNDTLFPILCV